MASTLHYLTVQDILWINFQVTKKVHHYNFARLEEATYYQYAYGESNTLLAQASRFLVGFSKMKPIDAGNGVTAFVAFAAFLKLNGAELDLLDGDAATWVASVPARSSALRDLLQTKVKFDDHHHGTPDPRAAISWVLDQFPCTVLELASAE